MTDEPNTPTSSPGGAYPLAAFERAYPDLYWHIAKGKTRPDEPLYGALILDGEVEIGQGESDVSAMAAFALAIPVNMLPALSAAPSPAQAVAETKPKPIGYALPTEKTYGNERVTDDYAQMAKLFNQVKNGEIQGEVITPTLMEPKPFNLTITKEWFQKRAALEADLEIGIGRRTSMINLTPEDIAELEELALTALPKWAQDEIRAHRAAPVARDVSDQPHKDAIDYALRYGGMCRDCADASAAGICDHSGMPCDPAVRELVLRHALRAWGYGIKHGFIANPFPAPPADEVERLRAALERIERWFGEFPETGRYWSENEGYAPGSQMSFGACYGSNGERDYMRSVARAALGKEG